MALKLRKVRHLGTVLPHEPANIEVPEELPPLAGLFGFFGVRGSGKTVSMTTLLHKYKDAGLLQRVFLISPTYASNKYLFQDLVHQDDVYENATQESMDSILQQIESEALEWRRWKDHCVLWDAYKAQERMYIAGRRKAIDEELLYEMVQCGLADLETRPTYKYGDCKHPAMFLVIDDCMSSPLFTASTKHKNNLSNICIKHRHIADRLGVTIMIAMQTWKTQVGAIGRAIRSNLTCVVLWGLRDEKMIEAIHEEIGREISKDTFYKAYDYATSGEKYNSLVVEFGSKVRLRRNWDTIIEVQNLSHPESNGRETQAMGRRPGEGLPAPADGLCQGDG